MKYMFMHSEVYTKKAREVAGVLQYKKRRAPLDGLPSGAVSDKRPVLTGRGRESERAYLSFTDSGSANGL